jgi:3-hydroxybutyryl-CoA dehydrogenase
MEEIKKVGVLGCGLMGSGIAQVCAQAGFRTIVREIDQKFIDAGFQRIEKFWLKSVEQGKMTAEDIGNFKGKLKGTTEMGDLKECELIIEAVPEELDVKRETFQLLDKVVSRSAIIASNTSSLSITEMATFVSNPKRFIGMHFFNPVPLMKLVEVVKTILTDKAVLETALNFMKSIGKVGTVAKDNSGFIVNLLLVPYVFDAIRAFEKGVGSIEDIDNAMKLGAGHPMGPFTLADMVGLDTSYKIGCIMFEEYKESRYAPPTLLKKMVFSGFLGVKTGKGFYDYSQSPPKLNDLNF